MVCAVISTNLVFVPFNSRLSSAFSNKLNASSKDGSFSPFSKIHWIAQWRWNQIFWYYYLFCDLENRHGLQRLFVIDNQRSSSTLIAPSSMDSIIASIEFSGAFLLELCGITSMLTPCLF